MTQEQARRIIEALAETNRLLEKEMRYAADLRKMDQVAYYERHIAKLLLSGNRYYAELREVMMGTHARHMTPIGTWVLFGAMTVVSAAWLVIALW